MVERRQTSPNSIPCAEPPGRLHSAEQAHFTSVAYSSLMETVCQLDIAADLGWAPGEVSAGLRSRAQELAMQLSALHSAQRKPRGSKP